LNQRAKIALALDAHLAHYQNLLHRHSLPYQSFRDLLHRPHFHRLTYFDHLHRHSPLRPHHYHHHRLHHYHHRYRRHLHHLTLHHHTRRYQSTLLVPCRYKKVIEVIAGRSLEVLLIGPWWLNLFNLRGINGHYW
jgi:hypothetical protein